MDDPGWLDSASSSVLQYELRGPDGDPGWVLWAFLTVTHPPVTHALFLILNVHIGVTVN